MTRQELANAITGMTREAAADLLSISRRYLLRLIDGSRPISDTVAERVRERLIIDRLEPSPERRRPWARAEELAKKRANATKAEYVPDRGGWTAT